MEYLGSRVAAFLLGGSALLLPERAEACSCLAPSVITDSLPQDGAVAVPTDVVLWVTGGEVELLDGAGALVDASYERRNSAEICGSVWEVRPAAPLQPNTLYTLRATDGGSETEGLLKISFTTGDGPTDAPPPEQPSFELATFDASEHLDSCVSAPFQACLRSDVALLDVRYEKEYVGGESAAVHFVGKEAHFGHLELGDLSGERCLQIRARDEVGQLSEPVIRCFSAEGAPAFGVEGDAAGLFPACDSPAMEDLYVAVDPREATSEGEPSEPSTEVEAKDAAAGCSVVSPSSGAQSEWYLLILGFVLSFGRRRRGVVRLA